MTDEPIVIPVVALLLVATAVTVLVRRYSSDAHRRKGARFLQNRAALIAGGVFLVLFGAYGLATGGGARAVFMAVVLSVAVAAGWDRIRPVAHGDRHSSAPPSR